MNKGKNGLLLFFVLILVVIIALPACTTGSSAKEDAESTVGKQEGSTAGNLTITYQGEDKVIGMDEIMQLEEVSRDVTPVPKDDEEKTSRSVKGVLLEDVFQKFLGISQKEPQAIRLIAGDGYSIEVASDLLQTREIILAYEVDGEPLEDWEKPLRSVVPEVFEMYWVKNLVEIEIIESRAAAQIKRIIMMETRISDIPDQDYAYYEETDRAVKISDLLFEFNEDTIPDTISAKSIDGLEKNEKTDTFRSAFLKYTGQDSPMFISEDIPKGMWIKQMLFFTYGSTAYFSASSGFGSMDRVTVEGNESIKLTDIFSVCGISQAENYLFKALDDYTVEIEADSIELGYVYMQDNGLPAVFFEGLPKNTKVKDLIYIGVSE